MPGYTQMCFTQKGLDYIEGRRSAIDEYIKSVVAYVIDNQLPTNFIKESLLDLGNVVKNIEKNLKPNSPNDSLNSWLTFAEQKKLAYEIETAMQPASILSMKFFYDYMNSNSIKNRANEFLSQLDEKAIEIAEQWVEEKGGVSGAALTAPTYFGMNFFAKSEKVIDARTPILKDQQDVYQTGFVYDTAQAKI